MARFRDDPDRGRRGPARGAIRAASGPGFGTRIAEPAGYGPRRWGLADRVPCGDRHLPPDDRQRRPFEPPSRCDADPDSGHHVAAAHADARTHGDATARYDTQADTQANTEAETNTDADADTRGCHAHADTGAVTFSIVTPQSARRGPLVYSRGFARSRVIEPGRGAAYAVLFSEIGVSLLVTTLVGVLAGRWVDEQLGTLPIFLLVGFLIGAGSGTVMIYRLVSRFLKTIK